MGTVDVENAVAVSHLDFTYPGCSPFIQDFSLQLPRGSRCLLIGANGSGKTTLLQLVAGKYMVGSQSILVLGRSPFHDLKLTCAGELSYLGTSWRKDIAFAGYGVALQGDISPGKMIFGVEGVDPERRARLIRLLDIDIYQRLTTMSDGQRRRVQICMGLLKPYEVLLLDEITVDLDVLGRLGLLEFFRSECEERGATILYATHIFDGMENWCTHIAYVENGKLLHGGTRDALLPTVQALPQSKLLHIVEQWLRKEKEQRMADKAAASNGSSNAQSGGSAAAVLPSRTPTLLPSKHLAFFR